MALLKKVNLSFVALGLVAGSLTASAQTNGPLQSVLVKDKPAATVTAPVQPTPASPTEQAPSQAVWFGDTPALATEALQPQPTPIESAESKVISNGGDVVVPQSPIAPSPAINSPTKKPQPNKLALDLLGVTTTESAAGPRIRGVVNGGIANQIGIKPGDVLTSVQGTEIYSKAELIQSLQKAIRAGEPKIPLVGIRTGRPFVVTLFTEQLRLEAKEQSNPPARVQAMPMEPQIVRGNNPVGRAMPISQPVISSPVASAAFEQPTADIVAPAEPVLPMITEQGFTAEPTTLEQAKPESKQLPTPPKQLPLPPAIPTSVTASAEEAPQPAPQQQQRIVMRTVRLADGRLVQVQETQVVAPQRQVNQRPILGPLQQRPLLNDRPVGRILAPVRRFFGR